MEVMLVLIGITLFWFGLAHFQRKGRGRYKKYLQRLGKQDWDTLRQKSCSLGPALDISIQSYKITHEGYRLRLSGNKRLLPLLYYLGNFDQNHLISQGAFTLDGDTGRVSWQESNQKTLGWIAPIARGWKALAAAREAIDADPNALFHSPLWPEMAQEAVTLFVDHIDTRLIRDSEIRDVVSGLSAGTRIPLVVPLRPPGEFWQIHEALPYLSKLPASSITPILDDADPRDLARQKALFWRNIHKMPPGGEAQRQTFRWLQEHPEMILAQELQTPAFFLQADTAREALPLLQHLAGNQSRVFLQNCLDQDGLDYGARSLIREAFAALVDRQQSASGTLSLEAMSEISGELALEAGDEGPRESSVDRIKARKRS